VSEPFLKLSFTNETHWFYHTMPKVHLSCNTKDVVKVRSLGLEFRHANLIQWWAVLLRFTTKIMKSDTLWNRNLYHNIIWCWRDTPYNKSDSKRDGHYVFIMIKQTLHMNYLGLRECGVLSMITEAPRSLVKHSVLPRQL